jgi:putative peptidoglycan lipid II flippase
MVFSKPLVRALFQRGAFTATDTDLVSQVQVCYLIQIPFYVAGLLFVQFLSSIRRNHVLMYGSALNLVLDVVLNLVLMKVWGIAGIALSTSIVYVVSFAFLSTCSLRALAHQRRFTGPVAQPQNAILANGAMAGKQSSPAGGTTGAGLPLEGG